MPTATSASYKTIKERPNTNFEFLENHLTDPITFSVKSWLQRALRLWLQASSSELYGLGREVQMLKLVLEASCCGGVDKTSRPKIIQNLS